MKVLVTGGAGYIGSVLVRKLLEQKYKVRVFDKFIFGKESLANLDIEIIEGDIRKFNSFVVEGIDAVIHLAALSNDPTAEYNPVLNIEINVGGTMKVASVCKQMGIERFIHASSCSVYYTLSKNDDIQYEDTPVSPICPYALSKYVAERELLQLIDANFCPIILRKGTVGGYSPRMRYDLVVNTFVKTALLDNELVIYGDGEEWRPLIDVEDVAEAYIACLKASEDKVKGQIFNLAYKNYKIKDLACEVATLLDVKIGHKKAKVPRSYRVSTDKIKRVLGFEPKYDIYYTVNNIRDKIFNNPIYYNLKWLERNK